MLVEYSYFKNYLMSALEGTPELFNHALHGLTAEEADRKPDPERFSLREAVGHLTDWEDVWLMRMQRLCDEEHPTLEGYDEGVWAIEHNYAATDPMEQIRLFGERRARLVAFLRERSPDDWNRTALRPEIGVLTLEGLAMLIPLHDIYHLRPNRAVAQPLNRIRRRTVVSPPFLFQTILFWKRFGNKSPIQYLHKRATPGDAVWQAAPLTRFSRFLIVVSAAMSPFLREVYEVGFSV